MIRRTRGVHTTVCLIAILLIALKDLTSDAMGWQSYIYTAAEAAVFGSDLLPYEGFDSGFLSTTSFALGSGFLKRPVLFEGVLTGVSSRAGCCCYQIHVQVLALSVVRRYRVTSTRGRMDIANAFTAF